MPKPALTLPPQLSVTTHAGPLASHEALRIRTGHGEATLAWHGAHLLSWRPSGQREVFWVSPESKPDPAAIRGGVPVCWPWFSKQGQSADAAQHGPARNHPWHITAVHHSSEDEVSLSLEPVAQANGDLPWEGVPPGLRVSMTLTLGATLRQTLETRNEGAGQFTLSNALHSYYAVSDARNISIEGLAGLPYTDRLRALERDVQREPFKLNQACDRTYEQTQGLNAPAQHCYELVDEGWQRRIRIDVSGSRSVVVWNPGSENARNMPDVPDDGWPGFFCIEACNAGPDVIVLEPGHTHRITQVLSVLAL
ncbi:MAG: D-hexose-6-phosphate mutarotase [Pseudomonadota bacterium]